VFGVFRVKIACSCTPPRTFRPFDTQRAQPSKVAPTSRFLSGVPVFLGREVKPGAGF